MFQRKSKELIIKQKEPIVSSKEIKGASRKNGTICLQNKLPVPYTCESKYFVTGN